MNIYEHTNIEQRNDGVEYLGNDTNLYPTYHIAISPNGQQVATFNTLTLELNVFQVGFLSETRPVKCDALREIDISAKLVWSLAISDPVDDRKQGNMYVETLIALSYFDEKDLMLGQSQNTTTSTTITYRHNNGESSFDSLSGRNNLINNKLSESFDEEKAGGQIKDVKSTTLIISSLHARILIAIDDIGGLVRFLSDDPLQPYTATVIVVNVNGISKTTLDLESITMLKKISTNSTYNENNLSLWNLLPFFPQHNPRQDFFFPLKTQAELKKLYQNTPCLDLLTRCMENDYFMIEDYKDRVQFVEMYNLRTNKLEMIFHQRSESATTHFGHGSPAIAISSHKALMAYCRGSDSITIYLMENSLEVSTQRFPRIERILSLDFINNDESLLVIAKEKNDSIPLIIIWDLFSYLDNAIRVLQGAKKLFTSQHYRLVRSCGNILLVDNSDGSVLSVLDHPLIKDMLIPENKSKQPVLTKLPLEELRNSERDQFIYHTIFYQNGQHYDAETYEKIIISDNEPWVHNKNYNRMSAFLDDERTTQLFIGETSVQVWYRKDDNSKKQLKYIWVSPTNRKLSVESLEIGEREFNVTLVSKSIQSCKDIIENIHWPFHVNAVNDACSALHHLYKRRDEPAGPKKQQQYETLVNKIERMIIKFINKRPAIWRLIDVRYNVMASLINGHRVHLIKQILNKKKESDSSMKFLHIPRLYEWPRKEKLSDLEIAIKSTEGRRERDAVIVGLLLDYYSENGMDNTGWMFTVSRAIPLLFEYRLDTYAKDLFSKPIFGTKEIHLDESHINSEDLPSGKVRYIKAFNQNTALVPKKQLSLRDYKALQPILNVIDKSKTSFTHNQQLAALQKVIPGLDRRNTSALIALRSVPLPDFTVYPQGTKDETLTFRDLPLRLLRILIWPRGYAIKKESKLSPFIRVITRDKEGIVLDNPAMEAVIDFKWESARNHFLRHILLFSTFAILFAVLTGAVKNSFVSVNKAGVNNADAFINLLIVIFYYLGYYLLASEVVQFNHEGWRRYISVYNFFDLASIMMPLATYTVLLIRESQGGGIIPKNQLQQLTIATSFTILVLWLEMFLLLRYFAVTGNFIYIIINIVRNVWPFIAFMGIVILAHGHAMYLLLRNPDMIGVEPDGSQFSVKDQNGQEVYTIQQTFDLKDTTDNYFFDFAHSVTAVYFWINGRWDQLDQWNFAPVTILSLVASVLLIIIMQNMLIAFMTGVFDEAKSEGRLAVLKYRAELIAEYETLEKIFKDTKGNPRHIFYIGNINKFSKWLRKCEYYWKLRALSIKEKSDDNKYYNIKDDDSDDEFTNTSKGSKEWDITGLDIDNYDQKNINLMNRKSRMEFYSSWSTDDNEKKLTKDDDNDNSSNTKEKVSKKVFFKDSSNNELSKSPTEEFSPIIEDANNIHNEIVSLKDSMKTIEGSIDNRLELLDGKLMEMMNLLNKLATANNLNSDIVS